MTIGLAVRVGALAVALALLAGCERQSDLLEPPVDLGPFRLGLNIVVADAAQKVPISRDATPEEWEESLKRAVQNRFGRYQGDRFYNIGISVDGYALAPPGVPVLVTPKSVLVITPNVWDDARQQRLNGPGTQLTIFESLSGEQVIGTGITRSKREQMDALSYNAAKAIEDWFLENPEWFVAGTPVPDPGAGGPAVPSAGPGTGVAAAPPAGPAPATLPVAPPAPAVPAAPPGRPAAPAAGLPDVPVLPELPAGALYPETP